MNITRPFLYAIAPTAKAEIVDAIVAHQSLLTLNGIANADDVAYFFAQCATETQGFTRLEENLLYTSTKRLRQVWPSRFKSDAAAAPYVRNPKALANLVYGGRLGNRPGTDDGWDYRGSGCKQTTGRFNFEVVQKETDIPCVRDPALLRMFPGALSSACVYWRVHNLSRFVKTGDVRGLTKAIQGGTGGLSDRQTYTARAVAWVRNNAAGIAVPKPQIEERSAVLRKGSSDHAAVRELQHALQGHGYYKGGRIDGAFGDGTELAVREFQRDHNLVADGVVGERTAAALKRQPKPDATPSPLPVNPTQGDDTGGLLAAILRTVLAVLSAIFPKRS